ncbi:hypothetical protein ACO0LO_17740 [Undibacterium sp. TJN25]|uniref:hypothetical protein n=2 Tax=unclassified Undibacterium TaxID=2630295 RepID=UPI003BF3F32F
MEQAGVYCISLFLQACLFPAYVQHGFFSDGRTGILCYIEVSTEDNVNQTQKTAYSPSQEPIMDDKKPSKEQVREWLKREVAANRPPPNPEEIRRALGRTLMDAARVAMSNKKFIM